MLGGFLPERARSPFISLAVKTDPWLSVQGEVTNAKIRSLLNSRSGVVQEEQKRSISGCVWCVAGHGRKQLLDRSPIKAVSFGGRHAFRGDALHLLGNHEQFGNATTDVVEEGAEHREALIARPRMVVPGLLEVAQEAEDPFRC